jgi:Spy/CpxP family protein refolding chaperone
MQLTRGRFLSVGLAVAATAALALPVFAAQGDGPGRRGHREGRFRQVLTAEQMDQIRPWLRAEREASKPLMDLHRQLRQAVLADAPDQGKIAELQGQIGPAQAEALTRRTALAQRIAGLLTPEQREQLRNARLVPPFLDPLGMGQPGMGPGGRMPMRGPGGPPPADGQ